MSVYLIEAAGSGRIKIGSASNPARRIRALATACPFPIVALATREGGQVLERAMHRALSDRRAHLEWFHKWAGVEQWFAAFVPVRPACQTKLRDWLDDHSVSVPEFATRIGRTPEAVRRYTNGERIPDREAMPLIAAETGGAVTANDFFGIEDAA